MSTRGTFTTSVKDGRPSASGLVAALPVKQDVTGSHWAQVAETWMRTTQIPNAEETRLRRRARRQALALMVASSLLSILVLYGLWTLLRGVM